MMHCGRYDSVEDGMEALVDIYVAVLGELQARKGLTVFVHPVMPVLDLTRPIVLQFNHLLMTRLRHTPRLHWLDLLPSLLTPDGYGWRAEFTLDGTHAHPDYVDVLAQALNNILT